MNLCLDNPYKDVTIPRAKLRPPDDSSVVIGNPLALESASTQNRNSALNPYGNFSPSGNGSSGLDSQDRSGQNAYQVQPGGYTVKEEEEEVGRCYTCCRRCRKNAERVQNLTGGPSFQPDRTVRLARHCKAGNSGDP